MLWINFLHFYQPPTIEKDIIIEATDRSYKRIIKALKKNPGIKFTFNISGCLLDSWHRLGYDELINDIRELIKREQIELVGGSAFHAPLPFLPKKEIVRQIKLNEKIIEKYFGQVKLKGFFSTEMMYDSELAKIVKKLGYEWAIFDEISAIGLLNKVDTRKAFFDKVSGLKLIFRSRNYSSHYPPKILAPKVDKSDIFVTATDAELYGLRHNDVHGSFEALLKNTELDTITISEYLNYQKNLKALEPLNSSWESSEQEIANKMPYYMWFNPKNNIHLKMWKLVALAIKTINKKSNENNYWARHHLDRGLSSCMFWWASLKELRFFGGLAWSPDEIERGLKEIMKSIRSLEGNKRVKIKAEKIYFSTLKKIWLTHWKIN